MIIVIGGGQAAASLVTKYRALGGQEPITILSEEPDLPYQRPPLSKKYLVGDMPREKLYFRPADWYDQHQITIHNQTRVGTINREDKTVTLADGATISYDQLVLATGARPRALPQTLLQGQTGIYKIRILSDVDAIRDEFHPNRRLVIIGGGYIGLEAAAIARHFGVEVNLIEVTPRILGRVASKETADFIRKLHQSHGVTLHEGVAIENLLFDNDHISGVQLANGKKIETDFMIVGIGILPNSELAEAVGIACDQGILIDEYCRTNDPNIYAAGDCTRFYYKDQLIRLESVGNAIDQGEVVAANLAGITTQYEPKPWFWSDQYDMTLQIAGLNMGYDDTIIRLGAKSDTQSVWYFKEDQLIAVDSMGDARAYMAGKRMIEGGKTLPKSVVADPQSNLKEWL